MLFCFSTYEGDVVDGMRHGVGVLHSMSLGVTYTGDWVMGKQHGKVSIQYVSLISVSFIFFFCAFATRQAKALCFRDVRPMRLSVRLSVRRDRYCYHNMSLSIM